MAAALAGAARGGFGQQICWLHRARCALPSQGDQGVQGSPGRRSVQGAIPTRRPGKQSGKELCPGPGRGLGFGAGGAVHGRRPGKHSTSARSKSALGSGAMAAMGMGPLDGRALAPRQRARKPSSPAGSGNIPARAERNGQTRPKLPGEDRAVLLEIPRVTRATTS